MASRSLGTLTLDLVARIGGYTEGLGKAEREAQKRAKAIEKAFDQAGTVAGAALATIAAAGVTAFAFLGQQADKIAAFQDLSDKIGDTAESIASLKLASDLSETSFDTIASASVRLTASLSKTDDEAKGVGAAIKALGLDFDAFKKLSPVEQLEAVSRAMNGFADGAGKTAIAVQLFGKAGAELLPFMKDLAEQGRINNGLTSEQIKAADDYTKAQARLKSEVETFINFQAAKAIPTLTSVQTVLADIVRDQGLMEVAASAVDSVLRGSIVIFQTLAVVGSDVAFVLQTLGRQFGALYAQAEALGITVTDVMLGPAGIARAIARAATEGTASFSQFNAISEAVRKDTEEARKTLDQFQKRVMQVGQPVYIDDEIRRLQARSTAGVAPLATLRPPPAPSTGTKKDPYAEAQRYLESLQKQVLKVGELTVAEQALAEIRSGRLGKITPEQEKQILFTAQQVDSLKALEKAIKDTEKANDEYIESVKRANLEQQSFVESMLSRGPLAQLEKQRADLQRLADLIGKPGGVTQDQFDDVLNSYAPKLEKTKSLVDELGLSFTSAFEDAIVGGKGFSEVLKGLEQDIIRIVTRKLVTEPLGNALTGMFNGSGGGGGAGGFLSGIFNNVGGFFKNLFSFDGGGFTGSGPRAGGLDGKGGFMAMLHPNETVSDHTKGQGRSVVINVGVEGQVDQRTRSQIGAEVALQLQRAERNL